MNKRLKSLHYTRFRR